MDNSLRARLDELVGHPVDVAYSLAVQKINKYGKLQRRIIVLGHFSIFTLKTTGSGSRKKVSIQRQDHLYHLVEVKVTDQEITMLFPDFQLRVVAELGTALELIRSVYKEYCKLTNSCTDGSVAKFSGKFSSNPISTATLSQSILINMSDSAAFSYRFNGACKLFDAKPSYEVKTNLMAEYTAAANADRDDERVLSMTPEKYPKLDLPTIQALFKALFYGTPFIKVLIHRIALKDAGTITALEAISRFPVVRVLELRKVGATIASVPTLRSALLRPSGFDSFDISGNELEDDGMLVIADVLATWSTPLELLSVARLRSMQLGTGRFAAAILDNVALRHSLKSLDLSGNVIGTAASDNLQKYLESEDCVLQRIIMCNCQISGEVSVLVAAARCPTMIEINVSRNPFSDAAGLRLCAAIASSTSLRHIDMSFLKVSARVLEAIVAATFRSDSKEAMTLVLNGNDLGEEVGAKIASILSGCDCIHDLRLDNCELGQFSVMLVLKCLTGRRITKLTMAGNVLEGEHRSTTECDAFADTLATFVRDTKTIAELSIADNGTARATINVVPMVNMMKQGHAKLLKMLDIQGNALGDEGITALADHLAQNNTLHSLYLDHNNIKQRGFEALARALETNVSIVIMPFPARDYKCALQTIGSNQDELKNVQNQIESKIARNHNILPPGHRQKAPWKAEGD